MLMLLLAYLHVLLFLRYLFQGKKFPVFFSIDSWPSFQEKKREFPFFFSIGSLGSQNAGFTVFLLLWVKEGALGELFSK